MSKIYTQSIASLKTTTHDTFMLDAQQIMVYPGTGDRTSRVNLIDTVNDAETKIANVSLVINDVSSTLSGVADDVTTLETMISSLGDTYVTKTDYDTFVDSTGDSISSINTTINALGSTYVAKTAYDSFVSSTNSSISTLNTNVGKCALKTDLNSYVTTTNLNTTLGSYATTASLSAYAKVGSTNTFTETNTFSKAVTAQNGITASGGDIVVSEGVITFEDLIDGTVIERSGASGYQYVEGMPTSFENGVCYDIGEISDTTNLTNVKFTGEGRLVQTCELWFKTPATVPTTHQWPYGSDLYWIDNATGAAPTLIASMNYRIVLRREPMKVIASIAYRYEL